MPNQPSLLEGLNDPPPGRPGPRAGRPARPKTIPWLRTHGRAALRDPRVRLALGSSAGMLALAGAIVGVATLVGPARPDYGSDRIDALFRYTLLTDEFNKLSVQERADLIGQLVQRVGSMGSSDSVLLAAFASTISGEAREQLLDNASKLFIDMIDEQAVAYDPRAPKQERVAQIEQSMVEMMKLFERMAGEENDATDEERVEEAKAQAQRDMRAVERGEFGAEDAGRFFGIMNRTLGSRSSPHQTARGGRMLRDMTRHLRGQDIDTGKPLKKP